MFRWMAFAIILTILSLASILDSNRKNLVGLF